MNDCNQKLSWRERISFCSGDLAQNIIYQTVSIWLLFFYTNVYGLSPSAAALMFLVVRIVDLCCMPMIIEHLSEDEQYIASVRYIQNLCSK